MTFRTGNWFERCSLTFCFKFVIDHDKPMKITVMSQRVEYSTIRKILKYYIKLKNAFIKIIINITNRSEQLFYPKRKKKS